MLIRIGLPVLLVFSLTACANPAVKPWERGVLAEPAMTFGHDALKDSIADHVYFSKEATSGGRSIAGGGCGCN